MNTKILKNTLAFVFLFSQAYGANTVSPHEAVNISGCQYKYDINKSAYLVPQIHYKIINEQLRVNVTVQYYKCTKTNNTYAWTRHRALDSTQHTGIDGTEYTLKKLSVAASLGSMQLTNIQRVPLQDKFSQISQFEWDIPSLVKNKKFTKINPGQVFNIKFDYFNTTVWQVFIGDSKQPPYKTASNPKVLKLDLVKTKNGWNFAD